MRGYLLAVGAVGMVTLLGCKSTPKPDVAAAAKSTTEASAKSAEQAAAEAEAAKLEAMKTSFEESFSTHDTNTKALKAKIDAYEAKYQEFLKAANKKVAKSKEYKGLVKEHDAALPDIQALGPKYDEVAAWYETKKEAPTEEDVAKLNEDMGGLTSAQTEQLTKYGTWKAKMEAIKKKFKMKIDLTIPEPEADEGAGDEGEGDEAEETAEE